jgi:hypothetical protein
VKSLRSPVIALILTVSGCGEWLWRLPPTPKNPFAGITKIAVAPFRVDSERPQAREGAERLAAELVNFPGVEVVWPIDVERAIRETNMQPASSHEYIQIGRKLQADAILVCSIHAFDTYAPPRLSLSAALLACRLPAQGAPMWELEESGIPLTGLLESRQKGEVLAALQRTYDGKDRRTLRKFYAWTNRQRVDPETGWQREMIQSKEFERFCYYFVIRQMFTRSSASGATPNRGGTPAGKRTSGRSPHRS